MNFEIVNHPARLQDCWPRVSDGLRIILEYCPDTWRPEDIYVALKSQRAFLTIVDHFEGFFVTEVVSDPFRLSKHLNVWALYMIPDADRPESVRAQIVQELDRQKQQAGCESIRFLSPRKGWARFISEYFKEKMVVYERE